MYFIFFLLTSFCLCFEPVGHCAITPGGIMYEHGTSDLKSWPCYLLFERWYEPFWCI